MSLLLLCVLVLAMGPLADPPVTPVPTLTGPDLVEVHGLVAVQAANVPPKAGLVWRVTGPGPVARASSPRGLLQFAAPPGSYTVELLIIRLQPDGETEVVELRKLIRIGSQINPPSAERKPDPVAALGRIVIGDAGCTATVIYPRRPDGRWDILTAAHCSASAKAGMMQLKDGRRIGFTVAVRDTKADVCWLVTDESIADLPFAVLASEPPVSGTKVWQAGYGTNQPTVRKDGTYVGGATNGQLQFTLSVSHGDSGGGIFNAETGELLAPVCCTSVIGETGTVFGGSCVSAWKLRPTGRAWDEWKPIDMPIR